MFLTNVLLKRTKSKAIMVLMESAVSGHQFVHIRERLGDKAELIRFDPYRRIESATSSSVLLGNMRRYFGCRGSVSLLTLTNFLVANVLASGENGDSDRGFGHLYKWVTVTAAFEEAKRHGKPVFVLIHKAWCPACQKLKPKFANSIKLLDLSNQFVMVNVENNEEWLGKQGNFQPDGKYVPRILFFTPDGELIREAYNRHPSHDPAYRYFYTSPAQIADTMIHILNTHFRKSLPVVAESSTPENLRFRRDESETSTSPEDESIVEKPTLLE